MTSGDEVISDLVSENEYSYEENEKKQKNKKKNQRDPTLGKKKREDNTDEFISEDVEENVHSLNGNTDSNNYTSNSVSRNKRRRRRRTKNDRTETVNQYSRVN